MTNPLRHVSFDPDEWKLVPNCPTELMCEEGALAWVRAGSGNAQQCYAAMLSAAPAPQWQPDEATVALLKAARHYVFGYRDNDCNHPQGREGAARLLKQIDAALAALVAIPEGEKK